MYVNIYVYMQIDTYILAAHLKQIDVEGECVLEGCLPLGGHIYSFPPLGTDVHRQGLHRLHVHAACYLQLFTPGEEALDLAVVDLGGKRRVREREH